jgi:hypothetical protein
MIDVWGDHGLACKRGRAWIYRHERLKFAVRDMILRAGVKVTLEQGSAGVRHSKERPGDLVISARESGVNKEVFIDIGITHSNITNFRHNAIEEYYNAKMGAFRNSKHASAKVEYLPFISNILGCWDETFKHNFDQFAMKIASLSNLPVSSVKDYWRVRIQTALARAVAKSLAYHIPANGLMPGLRQ